MDFQIYQAEKLIPSVDHKTVIEWYDILRGICSSALLRNPVVLGEGINADVIEIDESLFGKKRKYHRGTGNQKFWVFGLTERNTRNSVLRLVEKRDKDTLIPIIKSCVKQGATIYSDMWAAYNDLEKEGYVHDTVNHSKEFRSSSGCCTNTIEGLWGLAKLRIKKMKGILPSHLPVVLDEFMFRYRFGHQNGDIFYRLLADIKDFRLC